MNGDYPTRPSGAQPAPGDPSPSGQAPDGQTQAAGAAWVQLDEPALAADRTGAELEGCAMLYRRLGSLKHRPALLVSTYFGEIGDAFPVQR